MAIDGWIKTHRKATTWEWYKVEHMFHLFSHLIINANHKDGSWRGIEVKRGQLITGLNALNIQTGIPIQTLRTCLSRLENSGEINKQSTNKYTIITICNYDTYNSDQQTEFSNLTNDQQTTNKQSTTNKNVKNNKEIKEAKKSIAPFVPPSLDEVKNYFEEKGYSELAAEKAWNYYDAAEWFDSRGKQVKNWKQKMNGVWFKPENLKSEPPGAKNIAGFTNHPAPKTTESKLLQNLSSLEEAQRLTDIRYGGQ